MMTGVLQSYVALYVPTTIHVNQPSDTTEHVRLVQIKFSGWFGAETTTERFGGYIASTGEMVDEKVYEVKSFCSTEQLVEQFPIVSLEDPLDEEDWDGWELLTTRSGLHTQLVGDDLFVTNTRRLKKGIAREVANAILFLASREASYITGEEIDINGGSHMD